MYAETLSNGGIVKTGQMWAVVAATAALAVGGVAVGAPAQASTPTETTKTQPIYTYSWDDGKCMDGGTPVTVKKRQSVSWFNTNTRIDGSDSSRLGRRTVPAGETVCRLGWSLGPTSVTRSDGVVTGISTPGYPTVADIKALGLTPQTPVAEGVWLPRPAKPAAVGQYPSVIRPVRAWVDQNLVAQGEDLQNAVMVEWEVVGGQGVMIDERRSSDGKSVYDVFELNPNGSIRIVENSFVCYHGGQRGTASFSGRTEGDFGQGYLPEAARWNWEGVMETPWHDGITTKIPAEFGPTWQGMPFLSTSPASGDVSLSGGFSLFALRSVF